MSSDETCGEYDTKLDNLRKLFLQSQSLCDYKIPTSGPTTNKQAQRRITIHSTKFDSNINDIQKNQLPSFSIFSGAPLFEKPMFKKKSLSSSENSNTNSLEHQEDNLRSVFKLVASEAAAQGMKKALLTDKNTEIARQQVTQKKLEAQTIELEERLMGIHQENEKLLSEMVLLREQNSEYRLKVESMQGLQAFMTTCPSDPKSLKESLYSAKQEIDKLKSEVKGLIKEKKMMETKLKERDNLEKNLAELKGKFKDLRHERNLIENSTKNDKKLIDSLKSKLNSFEESKQSALDEKEEELTNLKQSRAAEEEATKIQLQKLVSENNVANNRISELSLELSGIREKCTENEKSLSAANSTISDLNSTIRVLTEERDAANQKVEELKSIIQDADAKQVSIHFEFMQKEQKIEVEKQQLVSKLQVVESELQKLRCENQTLTSDCRAHSEELQKSLVTIEELQSMKRDSVDNLGALERENQILLQKLTAEENQCRELQCLKTEFEQKFEKLESEKIESIRALSSESSKNEQLQKNFNSLKNSLIELKAGIVSAEEKSEVLEAANKDNELCIAELNRKLDGANRERRACIDFLNRILQGEDLATESSDGDEVSLLSKLQDLEARFSEIKMQVNNVVSRSGMENDSENVGNRSNKDEADQELDAEEKFASLKKGMDSRTERKLIKYMHQYADAKLKEIRKENQHLKEVIKSLQK